MSQIPESYSRLKAAFHEATGTAQARGRWSGILLLSAATFMFWAALYLYVPILPSYAESLGATLAMVGAVIASYAIAQLLLRAPLGVWADFLGRRKPFVVTGLLAASLGAVVMGAAPGPWSLFAGRAITGVAATTWVVSTVFFSAYFAPERTSRGIGIISFVNSSAMVGATYLGGQLAELLGPQVVFFVAALLGIVVAGTSIAFMGVAYAVIRLIGLRELLSSYCLRSAIGFVNYCRHRSDPCWESVDVGYR